MRGRFSGFQILIGEAERWNATEFMAHVRLYGIYVYIYDEIRINTYMRIGAGENGRPTNSIIIYRINFIAEVDMNKCLIRG